MRSTTSMESSAENPTPIKATPHRMMHRNRNSPDVSAKPFNHSRWIRAEVMLDNKMGLHLRAAALLVQTANRFKAKILLVKDGLSADAKSILGIMSLSAQPGTRLTLRCKGEDQLDALKAIQNVFQKHFEETV